MILERHYTSVALLCTSDAKTFEDVAEDVSIHSFLNSFSGYLKGLADVQDAFQKCVNGCDIVAEKIAHCKQRLETLGFDTALSQIKVDDFLQSRLPEMDIVVGNPPYVRYENIPAIASTCCFVFQVRKDY